VIADGGPSVTARRVAAHRLGYDRIPWRHGDPAADDALAADVADGLDVSQGAMHQYLGARTMFFDRIVVHALDRGIRQIVIGGAGYDGRALRCATPRRACAGSRSTIRPLSGTSSPGCGGSASPLIR
jgi:O-methyltransferase involved in polyketide biosynthesis